LQLLSPPIGDKSRRRTKQNLTYCYFVLTQIETFPAIQAISTNIFHQKISPGASLKSGPNSFPANGLLMSDMVIYQHLSRKNCSESQVHFADRASGFFMLK
jgi:hypothetical protein